MLLIVWEVVIIVFLFDLKTRGGVTWHLGEKTKQK
jgi:hypothetical protein